MNLNDFLQSWARSATTSLGLFWMALWAFTLGYLMSSLIQVLVTRQRMREAMGGSGLRSTVFGAFFGFLSSSCSFAALSTTRTLFQKGAGLIPSLAFLLASTNLVIELGFVIAIFLGWQFVVGEYVGGLLLILLVAAIVRLTRPEKTIQSARERLQAREDSSDEDPANWKSLFTSRELWNRVGRKYFMEWGMVWKEILIGFTVAGLVGTLIPDAFFEALFPGSGASSTRPAGFLDVILQSLAGPLAAFFTFIGSMGNIPLAALLFDRGVSFGAVMAFIFSDLVVFPVLKIQARYYGWKMATYLLAVFLAGLVATSLVLHLAFSWLDLLPTPDPSRTLQDRNLFSLDTGTWLNVASLIITAVLATLIWKGNSADHDHHHSGHGSDSGDESHDHGESPSSSRVLRVVCGLALAWLIGGMVLQGFLRAGLTPE